MQLDQATAIKCQEFDVTFTLKGCRLFYHQNSLKLRKPYDKMLAIVTGKKWKDIRSTLSPAFSASKMKQVRRFRTQN